MSRLAVVISAVALLGVQASTASAQENRSGCARDVTRHCRAVMDNGDMAVLTCLKQYRAHLSKTCQKVLSDNNQ